MVKRPVKEADRSPSIFDRCREDFLIIEVQSRDTFSFPSRKVSCRCPTQGWTHLQRRYWHTSPLLPSIWISPTLRLSLLINFGWPHLPANPLPQVYTSLFLVFCKLYRLRGNRRCNLRRLNSSLDGAQARKGSLPCQKIGITCLSCTCQFCHTNSTHKSKFLYSSWGLNCGNQKQQ